MRSTTPAPQHYIDIRAQEPTKAPQPALPDVVFDIPLVRDRVPSWSSEGFSAR